eukprot:GFUD01016962.1.p1 GENE.GFUD01016962.1~~GFUD01016962.1.p1  ORF type:complete len:125 (-),score=30.80 GFUD01016962.1:63-437(-)
MANVVKVEGFEAFQSRVAELTKTGGDVFVMFSGSKDSNGVSWCPDCVDAEPVVNGCLSTLASDTHYLYVGVGGRDFWKDQNCVFRTAKETQLKTVPTLIKWGTKQRLEEGQCADKNLVSMMFEE